MSCLPNYQLQGYRFREPSYYDDGFGLGYPDVGIGPSFETESTKEVDETVRALDAFMRGEEGAKAGKGNALPA